MTIRAIIENFRSIESATIEIGGVTLIAGRNAVGKSSLLRAVAAALTGQPITYPEVDKKDARLLVRDGAGAASIQVGDDEFTISISYPKAEVTGRGRVSRITPYAAGLARLSALKPKERAAAMADYVRAAPTQDDLSAALKEKGVADAVAAQVCEKVSANGWDATFAAAQGRGPELKGAWREVTGEAWGSAKAEGWAPEGWDPALAKAAAEDLDFAVKEAAEAMRRAVGTRAVAADRLAQIQAQAATCDEADAAARDSTDRLARAKGAAEATEKELMAMRVGRQASAASQAASCPHCGADVWIVNAGVRRHRGHEWELAAENPGGGAGTEAALDKKIQSADERLKDLKAKLNQAAQDTNAAIAKANAASAARRELAAMESGGAVGNETAEKAASTALDAAQRRKASWERWRKAHHIHRTLVTNQTLIEVLGPAGVRASVLARELKTFAGDVLAPLCATAGWPAVVIDESYAVRFGGRPYHLCSASDQWKADAVLALAQARIDRSAMVILDGTEILDSSGRNQLVKMLVAARRTALIGMTASGPDKVPSLPPAIGRSYWIEDGHAKPLAAAG